jgi:exopolysaccharide/PEP-CTERM locus tyrosine autokinase
VSKIQKAIADIARQQSSEKENALPSALGKVTSERVPPENPESAENVDLGEDTSKFAALDPTNVQRRILIDREALRCDGFIAPEDEERMLVDQYRQIKRPLIAHAFGKRATKIPDGHLILVSSALSGDGKTFTCLNLALSMAREQDRSVLLVDADVAKAHITSLFGAEDQPGLLDLLGEDSKLTLNDVILETDIKGLSVMTAGLMQTHSTELLASERMESLIRALSAQDPNRIVIFDSSPLLVTSEARELTSLVGQVVLVVAAELTPQGAVIEALEAVDQSKPVNLILNQARHSSGNGYYGYGYGYGRESREAPDE